MDSNSEAYAEELYEEGYYLRYEKLDFEGAMKKFNRAIKFNPYLAKSHRELGNCLKYFKQFKEALQQYSLAIDSNHYDYWAYIYRGEIYSGIYSDFDNDQYRKANVKDISKAIEDFTSAIKVDPTLSSAYYKRGECYEKLKQYDKAIEDYTEAIEFDDPASYMYYSRGECYKAIGEISKAKSDFARYEQLKLSEKLQGY